MLFEAVFTEGCIPTSVVKSRIVTPGFFAVLKQLRFLDLEVGGHCPIKEDYSREKR